MSPGPRTAGPGSRGSEISGPSFDILANRHLADDLHYVYSQNREAYMLQDDDIQNNFVRAVLGLAYFRDATSFENWAQKHDEKVTIQ